MKKGGRKLLVAESIKFYCLNSSSSSKGAQTERTPKDKKQSLYRIFDYLMRGVI